MEDEYRDKIAYYIIHPETKRDEHANKLKADIANGIQSAQKQQEFVQKDLYKSDIQKIDELQKRYKKKKHHQPKEDKFTDALNQYEHYKRIQIQDQKFINQVKRRVNGE